MITATVTTQKEFSKDEAIVAEKLNKLGTPTITLQGTIEEVDIGSEAVTNSKLKPAVDPVSGNENADAAVSDNVVANNAGIKLTKIEAIGDGKIAVGNVNGFIEGHTIGGDVHFSRASKLRVKPAENGGSVGIEVGNTVRFKAVAGYIHAVVIGIDSIDSSQDKHLYLRFLNSGEPTNTEEEVLVNPLTITLEKTTQDESPETISAGDKITSGSVGSAFVKSVETTAGTADGNGNYTHSWEISIVNVDGFFLEGATDVATDTSLSGFSVASGATVRAKTALKTDEETASVVVDFTRETTALASYIMQQDEPSAVKSTRLVAPLGATDGQYLRVNSSGGFTARDADLSERPIAKGEIMGAGHDKWTSSTHANTSVWELKGASIYNNSSPEAYGLMVYNSNWTASPQSAWSVGDLFVVAPKKGGSTSPIKLSTDFKVYKVLEVQNASVANASINNMAWLKVCDASDSENTALEPPTLNVSTGVTNSTATVAYIGRHASTEDSLSGARLFKYSYNDSPVSCYAVAFENPAQSTKYAVIVTGFGIWAYNYSNGNYPDARDYDATSGNTHAHESCIHTHVRSQNGFSFLSSYNNGFGA